jgi:hypothetical protein
MCGTLRFEGRASKIGNLVTIFSPLLSTLKEVEWSGFAREEKLDFWMEKGKAVNIEICVDSFDESCYTFEVPGQRIQGIGLRTNVFVKDRLIGPVGSVKIITRPAFSAEESSIHSRWPLSVHKGEPYIYTLNQMEVSQQLSLF